MRRAPSPLPLVPAPTSRGGVPLVDGPVLGGFECSQHRLEDGRRLDMLAMTRHDEFAAADYARMRRLGMTACRDGISWVRVERAPARWDFSRVAAMVDAAAGAGVDVIWDLMHFGWPDHVDVFAAAFPTRFRRYAQAVARFFAGAVDRPPMFAPINEMSFLAWAGGDVRCMNPFAAARGVELKVQLVRATLEAIDTIRAILPRARFLQPEPIIRIVPSPEHPRTWRRVECDDLLQYQAWDMLTGRVWPTLGGAEGFLDVVGVNFYPDNQFTADGETVVRGDPRYRPLAELLLAVWRRYGRPMLVSETGSEGDGRAEWLRYVVEECLVAMQAGCEIHGVTLYPIVNHPGWVDGRHCRNGLWDYADEAGERAIHAPLAAEIARQAPRLAAARADVLAARSGLRIPA